MTPNFSNVGENNEWRIGAWSDSTRNNTGWWKATISIAYYLIEPLANAYDFEMFKGWTLNCHNSFCEWIQIKFKAILVRRGDEGKEQRRAHQIIAFIKSTNVRTSLGATIKIN